MDNVGKKTNQSATHDRALPEGVYRRKDSPFLWIKYSVNGKPFQESAKTANPKEAERKRKRRLGQIAAGMFHGLKPERVRVEELAQDMLRDYRINGRKSLSHAEFRWGLHLKPVFGHLRVIQVTTEALNRYVDARQQHGASNATINRELALLKRAFHLGLAHTPPKLTRVPVFPHLNERNVRKGFVEDAQYARLAAECGKAGLWMRALFEVAHTYGWREGELLSLRVGQVDPFSRTIRLNPGETKNGDGRVVAMTSKVYELLSACIVGKDADEHVLTREDRTPVRDFRQTWWNVCVSAGVGRMLCRTCSQPVTKTCDLCGSTELKYAGLLVHDLRRTAVRNMVRAGIPERVAMTISGHKTRSVFDRYNIVSEADLMEAARKLERRDRGSEPTQPRNPENSYEMVTSAQKAEQQLQ
jgi:integrase